MVERRMLNTVDQNVRAAHHVLTAHRESILLDGHDLEPKCYASRSIELYVRPQDGGERLGYKRCTWSTISFSHAVGATYTYSVCYLLQYAQSAHPL
jgi:hypothetical protein